MSDPDQILMQAAAIYQDTKMIEGMVIDALGMVHAGETIAIGNPDYAFGWTFYPILVQRSSLRKLTLLPGCTITRVTGDSLEQKFVNWLNKQVKKKGMAKQIHFNLTSDLRSSRYGLF